MRGEAIVVGAGPAGLSAALALAQSDIRVTLLEQHAAWPGRVCGGFLNPEGVRHLQALGSLRAVVDAGAVPVT
ncbi:MAG: FAD-dependent monooxygenase, partial [Acidobacteria bacterium]|nr:FAD-dependent monooxygenase [Acidobacteriota bacterium]